MKTTYLSLLLLTLLVLSGCFPNTARTNAKLEPGFDLALSGGTGYMPEYYENEMDTWPDAEVNLQYASAQTKFPMAFQLKVPLYYVFSTLDFYAQLGTKGPHYYGTGVELGLLSSIYGVYTYYFTKQSYLTFTQRIHYAIPFQEDKFNQIWINPQIAFGFESPKGLIDTGFYLAYNYIPGDGYDYSFCIECDRDPGPFMRKHFMEMGIHFRL